MPAPPPSSQSRALLPGGAEVPIVGSDILKWTELTVHSPFPSSAASQGPSLLGPRRSASSCHAIPGNPPSYVIWRIHDDRPDVLEIFELFPSKEFPESGIRLIFPEPLCPFSFVYGNDEALDTDGIKKFVYVVTVSGFAYHICLKNLSAYLSGSIHHPSELQVHDIRSQSSVTAVAAIAGCLFVGRQDGSIGCYKLGSLRQNVPGFALEFRDDAGIGRLWNLVSRGRAVGPVQYIAVSEVSGRKLLFSGHIDGSLRVWDLISNTKILNYSIGSQESAGSALVRLWVGDANYETGQVLLAVLFQSTSEKVVVCSLDLISGDKLLAPSIESSLQVIPMDDGKLVDLKLMSDKVWILGEDRSMIYNLYCSDIQMGHTRKYYLHEDFIADQLFLDSESSFDDLARASISMLSSIKDKVPSVISSIFLRRLLQPSIYLGSALHATVSDLKKLGSQYHAQSLTLPQLKREILTIIENQGHAANTRSIVLFWKNFCSQYLRHWRQENPLYSLFMDHSSGAICCIRKRSISVLRNLNYIETSRCGSFDDFCVSRSSMSSLSDGGLDNEILCEVLKCLKIVNHHLGTAAAAILYECLVDSSIISNEDVMVNFVKELNAGCYSGEVGDIPMETSLADHRNHRKFSVKMLSSLHMLYSKAISWGRVLDVVMDYLKNFVPDECRKPMDTKGMFNINSCLLMYATSQVSKVMFDSAVDMLIFLWLLVSMGPQIFLTQSDVTLIKLKMMPMVLEVIAHWQVLHLIGTIATELPSLEDFSYKLSSLHIDSNPDGRSFKGKLGTSTFTLAFLLNSSISSEEMDFICSTHLPNPGKFINPLQGFCNRILWDGADDKQNSFLQSMLNLSCILLQHGQYGSAEKLLLILDAHLRRKTTTSGVQYAGGEWSACLHLLGFCILVHTQVMANGMPNERIRESVRCFFRAASGEKTVDALRSLSFQTGLVIPGSAAVSSAWRFFYYQWAMQLFEQYNLSDAACEFALAALEQVDEVLADDISGTNFPESPSAFRGRLWANIFKFSLDLNRYSDAYCAVISNPDEDSKRLCLRRFIIVLCERDEMKIICDGRLPFVGLIEKVDKELIWKAERSDISSKPNMYKLLYAFEVFRKNWRKAATHIYQYSVRLRHEANLCDNKRHSSLYQEILSALSASINALQLVSPSQAWIDSWNDTCFFTDNSLPIKRSRKILVDNSGLQGRDSSITAVTGSPQLPSIMDIEMLEKEYVLTLAQYILSSVKVNLTISGDEGHITSMVDALVRENFYNMAFTIILKCLQGSKLKSELERVFIAISQKCCENYLDGSLTGISNSDNLLLTSSEDLCPNEKLDNVPSVHQSAESPQWEMLEKYLESYKKLHPRLPVIVAETLLYSNPQIELPLWLVHIFKGGRTSTPWGMAGREADPATLFRLYINYGRLSEASNLLLEYIEAFTTLMPVEVINRKRMSAAWFPYVASERLLSHLSEVASSGHIVDQCDGLKDVLYSALQNHLNQIKVDSEDALVSFTSSEQQ